VTGLAARLGYSERHLTRVLVDELGAGPLALARAHRAQTARLLLGTALPISEVAFAAGFGSIRQFNDTIAAVYERTPSELRSTMQAAARPGNANLRTTPDNHQRLREHLHAGTPRHRPADRRRQLPHAQPPRPPRHPQSRPQPPSRRWGILTIATGEFPRSLTSMGARAPTRPVTALRCTFGLQLAACDDLERERRSED